MEIVSYTRLVKFHNLQGYNSNISRLLIILVNSKSSETLLVNVVTIITHIKITLMIYYHSNEEQLANYRLHLPQLITNDLIRFLKLHDEKKINASANNSFGLLSNEMLLHC